MLRQIALLATAQALFQTASVMVMAVGGLAGALVAPRPELATAPIAAMFLGVAVATMPASIWMARVGRRAGFVAGATLGALGGASGALGMATGSLVLLCLGTFLVGAYQGFAQFYRFAAAELATDALRPRALSLVLAGGIVAAFLGPAIGRWGIDLLPESYGGSFLLMAAVSIVAALLLLGLRAPPPVAATAGTGRPLREIMRQPRYAVALFGAATGYGVMILAMTATPLAMTAHHHGLDQTTLVIQQHVLAMFVPSFFTGSLIARFGIPAVMLAGVALLACHVGLSLTGTGMVSFASALIFLGIGWNFLYVGGSAMLTGTYSPGERARAQAANDMTVFAVGLAASLGAGALFQAVGWQAMNLLLLPWLLAAAVAIVWIGRRQEIGRPA